MKVIILGLTITSSWGNGHATTYRSLLSSLGRRGHRIIFFEKDQEWYRNHCDHTKSVWYNVVRYESWRTGRGQILAEAKDADAVIIGSYFPDAIEAAKDLACCGKPLVFYDIDTPITLAALRSSGGNFYLNREIIPLFDLYLSFTGGPILAELETTYGCKRALPLYCSVDADAYRAPDNENAHTYDMSYMGTYASDRQAKLEELLNQPAMKLHEKSFLVAGAMYPVECSWPQNVHRVEHVPPTEHVTLYRSSKFTLNLTREEMVLAGYSPSVRLFEASACGTAILSDWWKGLDCFLKPGEEVLIVRDRHDVCEILSGMSSDEARRLGRRAQEAILDRHTSSHRARELEGLLSSLKNMAKTPSEPVSNKAGRYESELLNP